MNKMFMLFVFAVMLFEPVIVLSSEKEACINRINSDVESIIFSSDRFTSDTSLDKKNVIRDRFITPLQRFPDELDNPYYLSWYYESARHFLLKTDVSDLCSSSLEELLQENKLWHSDIGLSLEYIATNNYTLSDAQIISNDLSQLGIEYANIVNDEFGKYDVFVYKSKMPNDSFLEFSNELTQLFSREVDLDEINDFNRSYYMMYCIESGRHNAMRIYQEGLSSIFISGRIAGTYINNRDRSIDNFKMELIKNRVDGEYYIDFSPELYFALMIGNGFKYTLGLGEPNYSITLTKDRDTKNRDNFYKLSSNTFKKPIVLSFSNDVEEMQNKIPYPEP